MFLTPAAWALPGATHRDSPAPAVNVPSRQEAPGARAQEERTTALRVFLDCDFECDFDYLRREITFVNWVRDRQDAQVHVLVTTRDSGGGEEWTFEFIGLEDLADRGITLLYNSSDTDTEDEVREGYAQVLRIGLLNFIVNTPAAERVEIIHQVAEAEQAQLAASPEDDPWNFWVFRVEFETELEGEQRQTERTLSGEFSADRTTEEWKIRSEIDARFSDEEFELSDGRIVTSDTQNYGGFGQVVKSLGPHWGASIRGSADSSTFDNQDLAVSAAPGIEYNIFPYAESSRRQLTFTYEIGFSHVSYNELTIFNVLEEYLYDQNLLVNYDVTQPWGQIGFFAEAGNFLNHFDQYRVETGGRAEVRIIRGLSLNVDGEFSWVRDQRFLPREDATDEEILTRQRALATDYQYEFSVSISYTFGSIFNNVVNPRFNGRRRGGFF
jgi:hypothetical protein